MNLADGIDLYVAGRRATGIAYAKGEEKLLAFSRYLGELELSQIRAHQMLAYLNSRDCGPITWQSKYQTIHRFFEFWSARGMMPDIVMPPGKPGLRQTFVPYIYTRLELRSMLRAMTVQLPMIRRVECRTLRAFTITLYGTGARVSEVLRLGLQDVDLRSATLTFGKISMAQSRRIPIGLDLADVLTRYMKWRRLKQNASPLFFVTNEGQPVTRHMVTTAWSRVRGVANVKREDGGRLQPRLQDLRCTFAVHRITSWIRNGADLSRMLPALAAYMGQVGLGSTEKYLALTPERFREELNKLSPLHIKKHWRDDKELMQFLTSL